MEDLKLMIPGPCELDDSVLAEMSRPMVAHYGSEWAGLYNATCQYLKRLLNTENDTFVTVGSGHLALETIIGNVVCPGDVIVIVNNGHFANRAVEIATIYGAKVIGIDLAWGASVTAEQVEAVLKEQRKVTAVLVVHNETSTGAVNPIKDIGEVTSKYDALFLVDGVSSVGSMEVNINDWNIDLCASASQKGLESPPGLAIVAVSDKAWQVISKRTKDYGGWYMNLNIWRKHLYEAHDYQPYGITMAIGNVLALKKSLERIFLETGEDRFKRHREVAAYFRNALRDLGLSPVVKDESACSPTVTAIDCGAKLNPADLLDFLKINHKVLIAIGLGKLASNTVRVGHMGPGATYSSIDRVINGLKNYLEVKRL